MNYKMVIAVGFMALTNEAIAKYTKITKHLEFLKKLNSASLLAGVACVIGSLFTSGIPSMALAVISTLCLLTLFYIKVSVKYLNKIIKFIDDVSYYIDKIATRSKGEEDYKELIFFYADIYHSLPDIDTRFTPDANRFNIKMQTALSTSIALIVKSELWKINRDDVVKLFKIDTSKCTEQDIDVLCNRIVQKFGLKEYYYD